jgi:Ca2+-binding RTX toxin-like protein
MARKRTRSNARVAVFTGVAAAAALAFPGAASAAVSSQVANGDLVVTSNAGDQVVITDVGGQVKVNGDDPQSGPATSATIDSIAVTGGPDANSIDLKGVTGTAFPLLRNVTVDGAGGNDNINGSQLADVLDGGAGNDRIVGDDNQQDTFDVMRGGDGDDTLVWNPGDDDDINEGGAGADTSEVNGGGKEQFEVKPSATPDRVLFERVQPNADPTFLAPFKVDISDDTERLDLNAGAGDDIVNSAAGLDALSFALDVDGGDGNDTIDGGDGADLLSGGNGNDRLTGDDNPQTTRDIVRGDAGDDTMIWNGGDDDDVNEGGDGNDTTEVNGAAAGEQFTVKPSLVTPGGVRFDRTGPTPPGPFSIEISSNTERLDLNANAGNDSVSTERGVSSLKLDVDGAAGNDNIEGGDAADLLSGGADQDVFRSRDKAADEVDGGDGVDLAKVDKRDSPRNVEAVIGGGLRVRHLGGKAITVAGNVAAVRLRSVGTGRSSGRVRLLRGGKSLGSVKYTVTRKPKTVRIKLNRAGRRLLAGSSSKGKSAKLQIDAHDRNGNGWRTTIRITLKR